MDEFNPLAKLAICLKRIEASTKKLENLRYNEESHMAQWKVAVLKGDGLEESIQREKLVQLFNSRLDIMSDVLTFTRP